jgi:hypothetical protein
MRAVRYLFEPTLTLTSCLSTTGSVSHTLCLVLPF